MPGTIAALWPQVHAAFAGVDCILHAGDLHVGNVIDELELIAPTFVCTGNGDLDVEHPKLKEHWQGQMAGIEIGLIHKFPTPRRANAEKLEAKLRRTFFSGDPQIVVYGHTHLAEVHRVEQKIYINPGSATLPNNQSTRLGTLGMLTIEGNKIDVQLYQITPDGTQKLEQLCV